MLSRTMLGSLALLFFVLFLLANCATPSEARIPPPLTPPIAPQGSRLGPFALEPVEPVTATGVVTANLVPSPTPAAMPTISTVLTPATIITPDVAVLLPTVTPTPPALLLLPTPTPALLPSSTVLPAALSPTVTATTVATNALTIAATATITPTSPITADTGSAPSSFVTASVPLPASYQAQGSFASQTVFSDSTISQQQGTFSIVQAAAANAYGADQQITLRTQRATGVADEINVYQIGDYIAVSYTGGEWTLVRRDQGSNVVRAIQPITDLAILFPRIIHQAEFIAHETIADASSLRYRLDDPNGQEARLIQSLLALSGEIRSLELDVWIAVPGGYVAAYNFQVELSGARVLDTGGSEVRADQAVTWTYQLTPDEEASPLLWPADAPTPDAFPVTGFAPGDFPIPPETSLVAFMGGVPDLISELAPAEVENFYRIELPALGWTVEGEGGLLLCSKEGTSFQLLITEDAAQGGTRISVLPEE
jgi:hypothetical protein